jgi:hypothetical protein
MDAATSWSQRESTPSTAQLQMTKVSVPALPIDSTPNPGHMFYSASSSVMGHPGDNALKGQRRRPSTQQGSR